MVLDGTYHQKNQKINSVRPRTEPETIDFPELRRIILADSRQVVMHQTLDASIDALLGDLPAVAPVAETLEEEEIPRPTIQFPDFNQGLRDAVDKLQEVVDQLRRLMQ